MGESLFFPPTSGNKGSSGSHKNLASHIPGADLLKLDWSKIPVLCLNMYRGKACGLGLQGAGSIFLARGSCISVLGKKL